MGTVGTVGCCSLRRHLWLVGWLVGGVRGFEVGGEKSPYAREVTGYGSFLSAPLLHLAPLSPFSTSQANQHQQNQTQPKNTSRSHHVNKMQTEEKRNVLNKNANNPLTRSRTLSTDVRATANTERKAEKMVLRKDWMRPRMELMREEREEVMLDMVGIV